MRPGAESSWYDKPTTLPDGQSFIPPAYCDSPDHPRNTSALYRDHTHSRQFTLLLQQIFLLSLCTYMRSKHEANSRAFSVSATSTWNSLPAHIRSIDTLSTTITTTASTSSPVNLADQTREPQSNCNRNDFWCDE